MFQARLFQLPRQNLSRRPGSVSVTSVRPPSARRFLECLRNAIPPPKKTRSPAAFKSALFAARGPRSPTAARQLAPSPRPRQLAPSASERWPRVWRAPLIPPARRCAEPPRANVCPRICAKRNVGPRALKTSPAARRAPGRTAGASSGRARSNDVARPAARPDGRPRPFQAPKGAQTRRPTAPEAASSSAA